MKRHKWIMPDANPETLVERGLTEMVYEKVDAKTQSAEDNNTASEIRHIMS